VGPSDDGSRFGGIRNIVQVIAVNAGTGDVAHFQQVVRERDADTSVELIVKNLWPGQRYHFLVLTGHRERNYTEETNPSVEYKYKTNPPTLLAAGLLADREIKSGDETLSIPMKPLAVDTVFTYEGVTVPAALPVTGGEGGTKLSAGVKARIVWTLSGGIETLRNAQAGLSGINLNWGGLLFKTQNTILRLDGDGPTEAPTTLAGNNQIALDLGALEAGKSGSANFKLEYLPFGFSAMDDFIAQDPDAAGDIAGDIVPDYVPWIIRNGVNDLAQDTDTTFALENGKIPWGVAAKNGNGAVVFTAESPTPGTQIIGAIDLTNLVPAPLVGGTPVVELLPEPSQYTGDVAWTRKKADGTDEPHSGAFEAGKTYTATVTLKAKPAYTFAAGTTLVYAGVQLTPVSNDDGSITVRIGGLDESVIHTPW
jgi:hypothetical protein